MTSVLIVEDDQMLGRAVYRDLTEYGFAVQIAGGVDPALDVLRSSAIDVLLTDLRLGTADGIDLLETAREVSPRTRAVLMSGFATARDYQRAVELGVVRVLCKPFTRAELIQCIRQAIDCETGFRGSIHGLSLVDVLQMFNLSRRSVAINVAGQSPGRMYLRDGQLIHAEHQRRSGEQALASILAMPAGSLTTSVIPETIEESIHRDFRAVLLDALSSVDEAMADSELDSVFDNDLPVLAVEHSGPRQTPPPSVPVAPVSAGAGAVLERVAAIDGFLGACLVRTEDGAVLAHLGKLDLRPGAPTMAELVRQTARNMLGFAGNDPIEDVIITDGSHVHLLRDVGTGRRAFVHLVLDRRQASPAMAKLALAGAVRGCEP